MEEQESADDSVQNSASDTEYDSEQQEFYFESDHLALRGNADYRSVLRTIVILEAQRIEAAKHIEKLAEEEYIALRDPEAFVQKLAKNESLDLPGPINIQALPNIKFEKYNVVAPAQFETQEDSSAKQTEINDLTVRGRQFDQTKPETFNQLWTCEEQRRLEELLIEFPPEQIEMRRFTKIAKALGNRTARQVASRLQKYFQKLHAAGLPIPGRIPRSARHYISTRKNRLTKQLIRPTTFFPSNYVPVNMPEDDHNDINSLDPSYYRNGCDTNNGGEGGSGNDREGTVTAIVDVDSEDEINQSEELRKARLIKRVKRDKERDYSLDPVDCEHFGFKCDYCDEDPISGTRWHCNTCANESIDFCSDCFVAQLNTENPHSLYHIFVGLRISNEFRSQSDDDSVDADYDEMEAEKDETLFEDTKMDIELFDTDKLPVNTIYDKEHVAPTLIKTEDIYNYLNPNFLSE